jgi:Bacterial Ig-like domain (group 3)
MTAPFRQQGNIDHMHYVGLAVDIEAAGRHAVLFQNGKLSVLEMRAVVMALKLELTFQKGNLARADRRTNSPSYRDPSSDIWRGGRMTKTFRSPVWPALRKITWVLAVVCGLHALAVTKADASGACTAINGGAFNLTSPASDAGHSAILTDWSVGDRISVTFTDAVGLSHTDGLYKGPLNAIAALQTVAVPSGGNGSFTYTVVSGDLTSGILVDPENNDTVTATCTAAPVTASATGLTAAPNPSVVGQSVTLTATVSGSGGTPTGTVTFKDGASSLGNGTLVGGTASLSISALTIGGHTLSAVYGGDTIFLGSTSSGVPQTVNKGATTTSVAGTPNPSQLGQSVTFTATVAAASPAAGTPTGSVTFKDGANALGTGTLSGNTATFATTGLALGNHSITAAYGGDSNFTNSASSTLTQAVINTNTARTWVSSAGDDNNDCSRTAPCLTFAGALEKTASGGEIDCLDASNFGPLTITKSITIDCTVPAQQ